MEEIIAFIASLTLNTLIPCILILAGGIYAILLIMKLFDKALAKSKLEKAVHPLLRTLLKILLFLLLGFIVASKLGVDVSGIIAVVSLASLAVSLAVQNALANVVGGFTLMSTHPFHAGDYVEVAGQSGVVQEIGITYTRLSTPDNKLVSIPNSTVTASQIVNYSAIGTRRVDISVSASYDADTELVLKAAQETGAIVTTEEANILGGLGAAVCEYLAEACPVPVIRHGVNDEFGRSGKAPLVLEAYGITAEKIAECAKKAISLKK